MQNKSVILKFEGIYNVEHIYILITVNSSLGKQVKWMDPACNYLNGHKFNLGGKLSRKLYFS